jgi:hypothetical protein
MRVLASIRGPAGLLIVFVVRTAHPRRVTEPPPSATTSPENIGLCLFSRPVY